MNHPPSRLARMCWLVSLPLAACKPQPELLYVSAEQAGEVVVVDPVAAKVVAHIAVGKRPRGLKLSPDGKFLYVAQSGSPRAGPNVDESTLPPADRSADGIGVVDLHAQRLLKTLPGGQDPEAFDVSADGTRLFVSNEETAELSVVDVAAGKVQKRVPVGRQPEGVTVQPDGKFVYVTSEEDNLVAIVDTNTLAQVLQIPTGKRPRAIAFSSDGASAFVTDELGAALTVIDTKARRAVAEIALASNAGLVPRPMGAVLAPDGKHVFVSTGRGGAIVQIDVAKRSVVRSVPAVGARPWGIAVSRDGKRVYTANGPSNDVSILELSSGRLRRVSVGGLPWGLVVAGG
jgi:YVTN family beta-propeller protein